MSSRPDSCSAPWSRFWRGLERQPGLCAVEDRWRQLVGDDFDRAGDLFQPTAALAEVVPNPDGHGPDLEVVQHGPDDVVGVDREEGISVPLSRRQLVVYALDMAGLMRGVAAALGLAPDGQAVANLPFTHWVGRYEPRSGFAFPVVATIATEAAVLHNTAVALLALITSPFLLLSPTGRHLRMGTTQLLDRRPVGLLPLADSLEHVPREGWRLSPNGAGRLEAFQRLVLPAPEVVPGRFPTPAVARWSHLRMRFRDGHTVWVQIGAVSRLVGYAELGMQDKRTGNPNQQWQLLQAFARNRGRIDWGSRAAEKQNQKRKERLVKALRDYFRIDGEPITGSEGEGWVTVFTLEDIR